MAQTSLIIGDDNWAVKETSLLGYNVIQDKYLPIPIDTVRATTATRVNEQGLIEVVPRNLLTQSNTFSDANWNKVSVTVTSGQNGYDGTNNAWLLASTSTPTAYLSQSVTLNANSYFSVYLKKGSLDWAMFLTSGTVFANFDLLNGVVGSVSNSVATIENVGNGWFRCSMKSIISGTNVRIYPANADNTRTITGNILIQNSQLEDSATATTYFPTTTRLNIPRIDYSSGSASLLVEPQRTNLFSYSEQFDDVSWTKTNATVTANSTNAPTGNLTADTITNNSGTTGSILKQITVANNSDTYNSSFFVKKQSGFLVFQFRYLNGVTPVGCAIHFNKLTGEFLNINSSFGFTGIPINIKAESYGDYFRFSYSLANNSTGNTVLRIEIQPHRGNSLGNLSQTNGNAVMWGAQLETGSYATSYIPTVASTVTRNADVISKTGISSLIGQTEGTLFLDVKANITGINQNIELGDGTTTNRLDLRLTAANKIQIVVRQGGVDAQNFTSVFAFQQGENLKIALGYKSNDTVVYVNGVQISSINTGTITGSFSGIFSGLIGGATDLFYSPINKIFLFKTRLSNSELQSLSTL